MAEPAFRLRIAGEDRMHFVAGRELSRHVLVMRHPWLDGLLDDDAVWQSERLTDAWQRAKEIFPQRFGPTLHGGFDGKVGTPDAHLIRAQTRIWHSQGWPFDAAIILRDLDDEPRRAAGAALAIEEAVSKGVLHRPVAVGHANPEVEAWVVACFEPDGPDETRRLRAETERLNFDPCVRPERLTAKRPADPRDAKRICLSLTDNDAERIEHCFRVGVIKRLGSDDEIGLSDFLRALERELVPVFGAAH